LSQKHGVGLDADAVSTLAPKAITVTANYTDAQGAAESVTSAAITTVNAANTAPVAGAQTLATDEDTDLTVTLTATDGNTGDTLTFTVESQPQHGALTGIAPSLIYTPSANYNGADSFTFKANDTTLDSNTATVSITINPVNDAPSGSVTISGTTTEDQVLTASNNLADEDGLGSISYQWKRGGTNINGATASTYTLTHADVEKAITVAVSYTDTQGTAESVSSVATDAVANVNDTPSGTAQSVTTNEDTAKSITLAGTDADGDSLSYSVTTQPSKGSLSGTAPNLTYTPNSNANGSDNFTFTVNDGTVTSSAATVTITVTAVNDTPTISDVSSLSTNEDTATSALR